MICGFRTKVPRGRVTQLGWWLQPLLLPSSSLGNKDTVHFGGAEPHKCDPNINSLNISNPPRLLRSPVQPQCQLGNHHPQLHSLSPQPLRIPGVLQGFLFLIIPSLYCESYFMWLLLSSSYHFAPFWTLPCLFRFPKLPIKQGWACGRVLLWGYLLQTECSYPTQIHILKP